MIAWKVRFKYAYNYGTGRTLHDEERVVVTDGEDVSEVATIFRAKVAERPGNEVAHILAVDRVGQVLE